MSITLDQVTKRYQGSPVVNDVSLDIAEGEFFVLLGPSGSGKSTLLRAIAGLTGVDHGRISLHGRDVTHIAARERGVGLVFQNYALFRHMTVADNIEFALRVRGVRSAERRKRRAELLELVALQGMDERLPAELSGGQQQRVAVARALAHKPEVLLLDEPFGALDAKIREGLRRTIREVQRELRITTVLVTHDQEEGFAMADRIGVMNFGRLLEVGHPKDLYTRPTTRFVATFLGAANLILARRSTTGIQLGGQSALTPSAASPERGREQEVVAVVRPEELEIASERALLESEYLSEAVVDELVFTGALERLRLRLAPGSSATADGGREPGASLEATRTQHEQRGFALAVGQGVAVGVRRLHVLPTPLSSFTVCAATAEECAALADEPLLTELAMRMRTRIATRIEPGLTQARSTAPPAAAPFSGITVIAAQADTTRPAQQLLELGAEDLLILPRRAATPQRVLIYWDDDKVRRATLAVSASVLRHLSAEAVYLEILPEDTPAAERPRSLRSLLDARSEAQAAHGLEMRTELRFGDPARELNERLSEPPAQMLILGIGGIERLRERLASLIDGARWPVLIVHRGSSA